MGSNPGPADSRAASQPGTLQGSKAHNPAQRPGLDASVYAEYEGGLRDQAVRGSRVFGKCSLPSET